MKKKLLSVLLVAGILTSMLAGCGSDSSSDQADSTEASEDSGEEATTIVCGTTTGYYPFVYTNDDDELVGYDIELITAVFDRLPQYNLQFELNEWDAILTGLDSGLYQISTECIFYSESRAEKYYYSDPIFYDPIVAVSSADSQDISTFDDMAGETTPVTSGDIWALAVESYNETHQDAPIIVEYTESDFFQLFTKAESGDFVLLTDYGMAAGIQESNDFNVRVQVLDADFLSDYVDSSYTYFLMSQYGDESAKFRDAVNEALAEVMADGTAQELSEKYFGEDFTPVNN